MGRVQFAIPAAPRSLRFLDVLAGVPKLESLAGASPSVDHSLDVLLPVVKASKLDGVVTLGDGPLHVRRTGSD